MTMGVGMTLGWVSLDCYMAVERCDDVDQDGKGNPPMILSGVRG